MQITLKGRRVKGLSYSQCGTEAVFTNKMQITMIILGTKKTFPRQESVSLVMNRIIVTAVTLESDLVQEDIPRMTTRVAT